MSTEDRALEVLARRERPHVWYRHDEGRSINDDHMQESLEIARGNLAALKEAGLVIDEGWSDDIDRAPRDGWLEMCNVNTGFRTYVKYNSAKTAFIWSDRVELRFKSDDFTHWRLETPLPAPPEAEK